MTRVVTLRCDNPACRSEVRSNGALWWTLDRCGPELHGYGEVPPPFHFCSWPCLAVFAAQRAGLVIG